MRTSGMHKKCKKHGLDLHTCGRCMREWQQTPLTNDSLRNTVTGQPVLVFPAMPGCNDSALIAVLRQQEQEVPRNYRQRWRKPEINFVDVIEFTTINDEALHMYKAVIDSARIDFIKRFHKAAL